MTAEMDATMRRVLALVRTLIDPNRPPTIDAEVWKQITIQNDRLHVNTPPPRRGKKSRRTTALPTPRPPRWYGQGFYEQTLHASIHELAVSPHTSAQLSSLETLLLSLLVNPLQ